MNAPDRMPMELEAPHSVENEQAVLGGLLIDNLALDRIIDSIGESDFYRADHRAIWRVIVRMIDQGKQADPITVYEALGNRADEVGGIAYLASLMTNTPGASNIRGYAKIVREKAVLRGLIDISQEAIDTVQSRSNKSAEEVIADVAARVDSLMERGAGASEAVRIGETLPLVRDEIDRRMATGRADMGISTSLLDLDDKTLGLHGGDLGIIAGRPSMGKTSLAMQMLSHCCVEESGVGLAFSMEMVAKALTHRMVCNMGKVDMNDAKRGKLDKFAVDRWNEAAGKLEDARLYVDDQPALKIAQIRARCRRMKRKHGLNMIVVDHLGLAQGTGDNRTQEVGSITRGLKAIAKEFNIPVIALCQLNRGVESRSNKRPMMSDLRESGDIEQDADLILLLYRDEYYNPDSLDVGVAEINVAKQRDGETGIVMASFDGAYTRFDNLAHYERKNLPIEPKGFK
jgi:replicative DNA helicase